MGYSMSTKKTWRATLDELDAMMETWRAQEWAVTTLHERHADRPDGWIENRRNVPWTAESRAVTVDMVHRNGKPVSVTENRHGRPADNLRVLLLCLQDVRANEVRGFGEVMASAYAQLTAGGEDPYTILGVDVNATPEQVKQAYRDLAKQHHPDSPGGSDDEMARINRAYAALKERS